MNKNLDRRIHPIAEADGLSPKKLVKPDLFGTLSIIPVDDGPMVVLTDKQLSECYVLDEAKDEK